MNSMERRIAMQKASEATTRAPYAPLGYSLHESAMELLCQVYDYMESGMVQPHPDAPGHSHNIKGIRDADGLPCAWCATWEKVRRICTENRLK